MPAIHGGLHTRSFQVVQRVHEQSSLPDFTDRKRKRSAEDSLVVASSDDEEPVTSCSLLLSDVRANELKDELEQEFGTAQDTAQTPHYGFWRGRCGLI
jgi:hypothetical protein